MGKSTGFLEYQRVMNPSVDPLERIQNFNEFHPPISLTERQEQGARCMSCGVPFCQSAVAFDGGAVSGCPLHNLIPEWNDEAYKGNWAHAKERLVKTSNFPEFTGRVCPALCEAACTCGLYDAPVTVRENELAIIETAFEKGYITPRIPSVRTEKRVAVIGSGPAGLAAADILNQRGHNVTVYERDDHAGGLLMYGIPNMKLEKPVIDRRISLMEKEGIEFVTNADIGNTVSADSILKEYDAVVLACGAKKPRALNVGEFDAKNVYYAVDFLTQTTKALISCDYDAKKLSSLSSDAYITAKDKDVIVVGGGDTGNDCVGTCIRQGCKSVVQIEMMPEPPETRAPGNEWPAWPRVLKTDYGQQEAIAVFGKDPRVYETTIKEVLKDKNGNLTGVKTIQVKFEKDEKTGRMISKEVKGSENELKADILLIAAGFVGCEDYTAKAFGVETTERGVVKTEQDQYATNAEKVFTAGDMHRGQSLVVWAISEGRACAKEVDKYLMGYTNLV